MPEKWMKASFVKDLAMFMLFYGAFALKDFYLLCLKTVSNAWIVCMKSSYCESPCNANALLLSFLSEGFFPVMSEKMLPIHE